MDPSYVPQPPPSLVLPPPPPAPSAPGPSYPPPSSAPQPGGYDPPPFAPPPVPTYPLQRAPTFASVQSTTEPQIDDVQRDMYELKGNVSDVVSALTRLEAQRDKVIETGGTVEDLHTLSSLTTDTGRKILALSSPLASLKDRVETLAALAKEGRAAATTMEVGMVNEELEVSKIHITKAVELVQGLAWEEVDAKDAWRKRMLDRIRAENPAMDEGMVALSTKQAEAGAGERIAQLDVLSYSGRMAAEQPFTELARLVEAVSQVHRSGFGEEEASADTKTLSGRTLVGDNYEKIDQDIDLEGAPLTLTLEGGAMGGGDLGWDAVKDNPGMVGKIKTNWRDYVLRVGLIVTVVGFIIGLTTYETIKSAHQLKGNSTTSAVEATSAAVKATTDAVTSAVAAASVRLY